MERPLAKLTHDLRGALQIVVAFVRSRDETSLTEEQRERRVSCQSNMDTLRHGLDAIDILHRMCCGKK